MNEATKNGTTKKTSRSQNIHNIDDNNQGIMGGALTNIFVIVGLAIFAFSVKYVLRSVVE